MKIKFDIDDVAVKYMDEFIKTYYDFGGTADLSNVMRFRIKDFIPEEEHSLMYLAFGVMMKTYLPYFDDFNTLAILLLGEWANDPTKTMDFVTARQRKFSYHITHAMLADMFGTQNYTLEFTDRGSKLETLKASGTTHFVDDRRSTCLELSQNGIFCYMPRRPWNEIPVDTPNILVYNDAIEIYDHLMQTGEI